MKVYFLNCSSNTENYELCLSEGKAGFKFRAPVPGDLIYLIINRGKLWYCGARGILGTETIEKPWRDKENYKTAFNIIWERCEEFSITEGLQKIYSNYGLALQPAKLLYDSESALSGFENKGKEFMEFMESKFSAQKGNFFVELEKFIEQSETSSLKYSHYLSSFEGLDVKVSFGQGTLARVPWISFLGEGETTSNGIYPVYLLYKSIKKLVLAFGVSQTHKPKRQWYVQAPKVSEYFAAHNLGDPSPYPDSYVFKVYDLNQKLEGDVIDSDLHEIISIYKETLQQNVIQLPESARADFDYHRFIQDAKDSNLYIEPELGLRFVSALLTKPFVILTGLSGSGKTKIAQAFAHWLCSSGDQVCIVPVGADWTNRDHLLGYPNAFDPHQYVSPENGALNLILRARRDESHNIPYFLILDEMNLSHVERYFADFLSAMESGEEIPLHSGNGRLSDQIPSRIRIPRNLFVIGTVNVDETTYMFSPKVLDRANVIEFRVSKDEISRFLQSASRPDLSVMKGRGKAMSQSFMQLALTSFENSSSQEKIQRILLSYFEELARVGGEFGYRSAADIIRFARIIERLEPGSSLNQTLDAAIIQKLIPKLHGSRRRLEPVLEALGGLCIEGPVQGGADLMTKSDDKVIVKFPLTLSKLRRMYQSLHDNGFASFAEA